MSQLRDYLTTLTFVAAIGAGIFFYSASVPSLEDGAPAATTSGSVVEIERDGGEIRFRLANVTRIHQIASSDDAVYEALRGSVRTGENVKLRLTPRGARFIGDSDVSMHWVESLEYGGRKFGPFEAHRRWSWRALPQAEAAMLRAIALGDANRDAEALAQFDRAIAPGSLNGARAGRAYYGRALALDGLAYPAGRELNERDDRLLVRAVADLRRAALLRPGHDRVLMLEARCLRRLGAYREALAVYDEAGRRWPREYFNVAIARAATWRQMGRYDESLRALDELTEKHGKQDRAMFHFHRAQTLNELARHEEAEGEASAALETRPDFTWAFAERSCAHASLGHIDAARTDLRAALLQWEKWAASRNREEGVARIRANFTRSIEALDSAFATAPRSPSDAACVPIVEQPTDSLRPRSAFLPLELPTS